jgi:serine/threonine-protein kinase
MHAARSSDRPHTFGEIETEVQSGRFRETDFTPEDVAAYREFASTVVGQISRIEAGAKYVTDPDHLLLKLTDAYRSVSMEEIVPDSEKVIRCLVTGGYRYFPRRGGGIPVVVLRQFLELLNRSSEERRRIVLANLHSKLDAVGRYTTPPFTDDDIPF